LIRKNTCMSLWSFQGAHGRVARPAESPLVQTRSLKTQQRDFSEPPRGAPECKTRSTLF